MKKVLITLAVAIGILAIAGVAGATPNGGINPIVKVDSVKVGK